MRTHSHREGGFGLIEILVTLGVIAFGSVSVTLLQAALVRQGAENRARVEAQLLAQARLDELRTQVSAVPTPDAFDAALPATAGFTHSTAFAGTNARFTRTERIDDAGRLKTVTVRVDWSDAAGDTQALSLATQLGYVPPQRIGAVARVVAMPLLRTPSGSASTGIGTAPDGPMLAAHDDGSYLYRHADDALALVAGGRIVLLLPEACATAGTQCSQFARIDGRVWIDRATQGALAPGSIAVVASGASWCTRFYMDGSLVLPVTPQTIATPTTASGDYMWFDYSCYVGSGWYGNVGIAFTRGFTDTDKVCIGDPLASHPAQQPALATRRIYRGMLHRRDTNTASGMEEVTRDGETVVRLYSHGIAAGTVLPGDAGDAMHDFVIGAFDSEPDSGPDAEPGDSAACITQGIMTRPDARLKGVDGTLFAGMPAAFVCLNAHLDSYDTTTFGHDAVCPVDPTAPATE